MSPHNLKAAELRYLDAMDDFAIARTRFYQRRLTAKGLRAARRSMRAAAQDLINATYAEGRTPSDYLTGALPRMYRQAGEVRS